MSLRTLCALITSAVMLIVGGILFLGLVGHNDLQNWQVMQTPGGEVSVIDKPGYYFSGFSTVWTYPRVLTATYRRPHKDERGIRDDSIKATFNDGGNAQISSFVRLSLPTDENHRLKLHKDFNGNFDNLTIALMPHLQNCIQASGPVMSASENQASRKAEFNQIVEDQLARGLFKFRRTQIQLDDLTEIEEAGVDASGNKIVREKKAVVQATEIVRDGNGQPVVIQVSPLLQYGLTVNQFSISDIDYDEQTLAQFAAKKESYLNAEKSKAQRQEEVQKRLMIEEMGRRQVSEIQAEENQKKTRALIQAQQASEVAVIAKAQAVTQATQKVEVANQMRQETETMKDIARIQAETAELDKKAKISAAEAQEKAIALGGGITEKDRVLAQIAADRDVQVAHYLSQIAVPGVMIAGGAGESGGNVMGQTMQYLMLRNAGLIGPPNTASVPASATWQAPAAK